MAKKARPAVCCVFCGRETTKKCAICDRCLLAGHVADDSIGRPRLPVPDDPMDNEDRYDEESGPDDVTSAVGE